MFVISCNFYTFYYCMAQSYKKKSINPKVFPLFVTHVAELIHEVKNMRQLLLGYYN